MEPNIKKLKTPLFSKMEPNIKKLKPPFQYCLTCYRPGHETNLCYKLKKETKKKDASPDKEMIVSEYVCHKVCEVQFGNYDLRMTNYLYAVYVDKKLRMSEYVNHKLYEVQYDNYDTQMSNYLYAMRAVSVDKELRSSEYVNHKLCKVVQYNNYDALMSKYLLNMCEID